MLDRNQRKEKVAKRNTSSGVQNVDSFWHEINNQEFQ